VHLPHRLRLPRGPRLARRLRILLATRPLAYWSLALLVSGGTGVVVQRTTKAAAEARRQWGEGQPALVATRSIAVGEPVDATDTEVRTVPVALRPDTALTAVPVAGVPAAAPLSRGEIVTASRVGRGGRSDVAALLPDGTRGVSVPVTGDALPLRPGDVVDVVAPDAVVSGALVVRVGDGVAVVAVPVSDAAGIARAVADGPVPLMLTP
jgi:Flp pilus assembly protein CpaB